ncbi:SAM-dependent methyltransferase [Curtobacterium sp. RHCJP20]|uniref:SAM-dependent methyltransferase n=1 Tax=Curtobacterium subtropicum TaxID=3055138 RepID=A0ABT7TIE5_9MICO|nr:SAM-dependent methyltransferase [Curtobacterium subtropicum]MDM7889356.1 SAM-dependent methyltransferase [Curtobacterium subtropicum]
MRDDLLPVLACPVCAEPLARVDGGQVGCATGHRFDEAKQGHLTLLPAKRRALTADTPEMVDARIRFLGRGHYAPVERALAAVVVATGAPGVVLDVGSGPGTYLAHALDETAPVAGASDGTALDATAPDATAPDGRPGSAPAGSVTARLGVALDLSAVAIRRAARVHPRAGAVVGDVTERLPVVDDAAAVVLDVFAPRNQREYARVLHPAGVLAVVTPRTGHLAELAEATIAVDPEKERRLRDSLEPTFTQRSSEDLTWTMDLSAEDVHDVVHMGPSHHHVDPDRVFAPTSVTAAVTVSTWTVAGPPTR